MTVPDVAAEAALRAEQVLAQAMATIGEDPGIAVETVAVAGHRHSD